MRFPVLLLTLVTLATGLAATAHAQPYDRDRPYDWRDRWSRDRDDRDWSDRWRWRCQRDPDWCRRLCWRDEYGFRCRHDEDDRYDWRSYWLYQRSYHDYYGRRP